MTPVCRFGKVGENLVPSLPIFLHLQSSWPGLQGDQPFMNRLLTKIFITGKAQTKQNGYYVDVGWPQGEKSI